MQPSRAFLCGRRSLRPNHIKTFYFLFHYFCFHSLNHSTTLTHKTMLTDIHNSYATHTIPLYNFQPNNSKISIIKHIMRSQIKFLWLSNDFPKIILMMLQISKFLSLKTQFQRTPINFGLKSLIYSLNIMSIPPSYAFKIFPF